MFDLKRPCVNCPFRKGQGSRFRLALERLLSIINGVAFQCHKTVDYAEWEDEEKRSGDRPQQCAGLMAVLHRSGRHSQMLAAERGRQLAERLTDFDPATVDPAGEAYASVEEATRAHVDGVEP